MGERAREEVDEWRHEDDQRYSGETRVENASVAFVDPTDADRHRGGGSRNPVGDGLGTEFTGSSLNGLQVSQSDRVEKRSLADHLTKGKSWSETAELIRGVGKQMQVNLGNVGLLPETSRTDRTYPTPSTESIRLSPITL